MIFLLSVLKTRSKLKVSLNPFHPTPLEWDVGPAPESGDEAGNKRLEEIYRDTAVQVRDLMETLRGKDAS